MSREALAEALQGPALTPDAEEVRDLLRRGALCHTCINPAEVRENEEVARSARAAAVLILLTPERDGTGVVLTRRTDHLRHHPGQISFPGGRQSAGDADVIATALREAQEEIALQAGTDVEILGTIGCYYTVTGFCVTPVLARTDKPWRKLALQRDPGEVAEILNVPLGHLMDPANYRIQVSRYAGYLRHYYETVWNDQRIWGATAGILIGLYRELAHSRQALP